MSIEITITKEQEPWKVSRPWLVSMNDPRAKYPIQWHLKTKKAAEEKKAAIEQSNYYRTENGLI